MVLGLAMRFSPQAVEEAWQLRFNSSKRVQDVTTAFMNTVLLLMPLSFCDRALLDAGALLYVAQMMLSSVVVIFLSTWAPSWYLRHRNAVILARQVCTLLAFQAWILPSPVFSYIHPMEMPTRLISKIRFFLFIPIILVHAALSHPMPLHSKRIVMALMVYITGKYCYDRCTVELVQFGEQGRVYRTAIVAAEAFLRRWLPLHFVPAIPGLATDAAMLSDFGACMAAHSSLQLALGVFFPVAVLAAEETLSRKAFERHHALSTAFSYRPKIMLALNLLIVPIEALVVFHCVARAVAMAGAVAEPSAAATAPR